MDWITFIMKSNKIRKLLHIFSSFDEQIWCVTVRDGDWKVYSAYVKCDGKVTRAWVVVLLSLPYQQPFLDFLTLTYVYLHFVFLPLQHHRNKIANSYFARLQLNFSTTVIFSTPSNPWDMLPSSSFLKSAIANHLACQ